MKVKHYLTCLVGRQWYAIPVHAVVEVIQMVALDELPSSDPDILGLLTLRSITMPVIDLRKRFKTDDTSLRLDTPIIAIRQNEQAYGLVVDAVDDVVDTSSATWQAQDTDHYVSHSVRLENKVILILDLDLHRANLQAM